MKYQNRDIPVWALEDAEEMVVEVVSRRLSEAVVRTKVEGKRAGHDEIEMLTAAINDRIAWGPGREPKKLIEEAEVTHANLEAVLLNAKRVLDTSTYGPLSPRANRRTLKPGKTLQATFTRLHNEVDDLMQYLLDPRLTSDSK